MKKMVIGIKIAVLILLVIISVSYEQDTPVYPSPCPRIYEYEPPETEPDLWSAVVLISTDSLLYYLWLNIVLDRPALHLRNPIGKVVTKNNIDFRIESDIRVFPGQPIPLRFSIKYDPTNGVPKLKAIRLNGKVICKDDTLENTAIKPAKIMEETTVSTTTSATISNINTGPDSNYFMPFEETPIETFKFNKTFLEMTGNLNLPWVQSFGSEVGGVLTTTQRNPWTTMRSDTDEVEDYRGYRVDELHSSETYPNGGDSYFMYNPQGSYTQAPQPGVVEPPCGTPTTKSQWPWRAAIYKLEGENHFYGCGGSLISHRHVITAAHCVLIYGETNVKSLFKVYLGIQNLLTSIEGAQSGLVQRIIKHPEISLTDNIHRDNVAILELSEPVKYTEWVRRVCLWPRQFTELESVVGKTGWLLGWGFTEKYDVTGNAHAVEMTVLSTEDCVRSNPVARQLIPSNSSKFCAASNADSVCWAASTGSGLYFKLGQRWHVRGAVSHAVKSKDPAKEMLRCDPTQNFIFTDYAKYLPWIRLFTFDL
ncbi:serine protease gd-like isoform X2 [Spodoptera frugiperda]|uniref:Serine protease gd-like isoform X2 n=1 Tax=Spodoptera frugiperda TaxID=7108 RepID=A0A9R0DTN2_SPOFR|nr:serine protease gd-like isoform X2 [Spodoptera frugiperda]